MNKILTLPQAKTIAKKTRAGGKTIVLVGGCFDILHIGHLHFLERAKAKGDILIIALEHDENVKRLKGEKRPVNPQKNRAKTLSALEVVDYVLLLPVMKTHEDYFTLVKTLKPDIIAVTEGDPYLKQKLAQAKTVGGRVGIVTKPIINGSTSKLLKILGID